MIARSSADVRDAVGVNTRSLYLDTPYGDRDRWTMLAVNLGVRWLRDSLPTAPLPWVDDNYARLQAAGFRILAGVTASAPPHYMERVTNADLESALRPYAPGGPRAGFLGALEGPNEPDLHASTDPAWVAHTADTMARLRFIARSMGITVPIVGPAVSGADARQDYGLEPNADTGNVHPYPGLSTQASRFPWEFDVTRGMYPTPKRFVVSETGWHTATAAGGMTEAEAAWRIPAIVLDCLARPEVERVFLHELVDTWDRGPSDPESNFGLVRHDFTVTPAYEALRWLLAALGDDGQARELNGGLAGASWLPCAAGDGTFRIAVWRPSGPVGVLLGQPAQDVRVLYRDRPDFVLGKSGGAFTLPTQEPAVVRVTP